MATLADVRAPVKPAETEPLREASPGESSTQTGGLVTTGAIDSPVVARRGSLREHALVAGFAVATASLLALAAFFASVLLESDEPAGSGHTGLPAEGSAAATTSSIVQSGSCHIAREPP